MITGDAFNVFVFLEISSLSTYVLIAQGASRDKRALSSAYNYLIMGTIGATFFRHRDRFSLHDNWHAEYGRSRRAVGRSGR